MKLHRRWRIGEPPGPKSSFVGRLAGGFLAKIPPNAAQPPAITRGLCYLKIPRCCSDSRALGRARIVGAYAARLLTISLAGPTPEAPSATT